MPKTAQNKSRAQLVGRLEALAKHMLDVAVELEYYGGFDQRAAARAEELAGAAGIARGWAEHLQQQGEHPDEL